MSGSVIGKLDWSCAGRMTFWVIRQGNPEVDEWFLSTFVLLDLVATTRYLRITMTTGGSA